MRGVRVPSLLALGALCALALSACDLLTASVFPDYLTRLEGSSDLSAYLGDQDDGSSSRIEILPAAGDRDLLFLTIWRPGLDPRLLVLDEDLDIVADWGEASVRAAVGSGAFGRTVMIDALGRYVVGSFVFDAALAPVQYTGAPENTTAVAHLPGLENDLLWVDNSVDPARLVVDRRDAAWAATTSSTWDLAPGPWSLNIERAVRTYAAPETYFLVFGSYGNAIVLAMPAADFEGGAPTQPLINTATAPLPYPWLPIQNARADSAQLTVDGFVVRTQEGERQLWGNGGLKETYKPAREEGDIAEAYSPFGHHYYALDRRQKELRKLAVWW